MRAPTGLGNSRAVNPQKDSEQIVLAAINLELAVKNIMTATNPPACCVLTASISNCRLVAMPTDDGDVRVLVYDC